MKLYRFTVEYCWRYLEGVALAESKNEVRSIVEKMIDKQEKPAIKRGAYKAWEVSQNRAGGFACWHTNWLTEDQLECKQSGVSRSGGVKLYRFTIEYCIPTTVEYCWRCAEGVVLAKSEDDVRPIIEKMIKREKSTASYDVYISRKTKIWEVDQDKAGGFACWHTNEMVGDHLKRKRLSLG